MIKLECKIEGKEMHIDSAAVGKGEVLFRELAQGTAVILNAIAQQSGTSLPKVATNYLDALEIAVLKTALRNKESEDAYDD